MFFNLKFHLLKLRRDSRRRGQRSGFSLTGLELEGRTLLSAAALGHAHAVKPHTQTPANFAGTWVINETPGFTAVLAQQGNKVSGPLGQTGIGFEFSYDTHGKVVGNTLHLKGKGESNGTPAHFTSKVNLTAPDVFEGGATIKIKGDAASSTEFLGERT